MSLPAYSAYADSGLPWLGEVPAHWTISPFKRLVDIQNGADHKAVEQADGVPVIGSGGPFAFASDYLYDGEAVLLGRKGTIDKPLYVTGKFWTVDTMYWSKIQPGACGKFVYYSALSIPFDFYSTNTALPSMTKGALNAHLVARPPLEEQTGIAAFLDRETGKIDALIAEQEKLLVLLAEKRQATISHAVTRGLNSGAPMKDSAVPWLGDVPAHWVPKRLGLLFRQRKRQGFVGKEVLSVYRDFGVIRKDSRTDNHNKTPEDLSAYQLVEPGNLVINKMKAWQGSLGISSLDGITSPDYIVFEPQHAEVPGYLHFLLRAKALVSTYRSISNGIRLAQWRLEPDAFLALRVFLPPAHEQQEIAKFIQTEARKIDALVAQANRTIELLGERRSALIAAAVTGKIDVRGQVSASA